MTIEYSTAMFTEFVTSDTLLSKMCRYISRSTAEGIASGKETHWSKYEESDYTGDGSVDDVIAWLSSLDKTKDYFIGADYDGQISATLEVKVPYTEEQVECAKAWLRDHPVVEGQAVTFRPFIPFKEFKESYDE